MTLALCMMALSVRGYILWACTKARVLHSKMGRWAFSPKKGELKVWLALFSLLIGPAAYFPGIQYFFMTVCYNSTLHVFHLHLNCKGKHVTPFTLLFASLWLPSKTKETGAYMPHIHSYHRAYRILCVWPWYHSTGRVHVMTCYQFSGIYNQFSEIYVNKQTRKTLHFDKFSCQSIWRTSSETVATSIWKCDNR